MSPVHYVMLDVPVTKRKAFTFVLDAKEEVVFTSPDASGAFEWLILNEFNNIILKTPIVEINLLIG